MDLPFVLMLQWFNLGFHYRGELIVYGQLLMVVMETGPQSQMFTVGSLQDKLAHFRGQRTWYKGWTSSEGLAAVLHAFTHVD